MRAQIGVLNKSKYMLTTIAEKKKGDNRRTVVSP